MSDADETYRLRLVAETDQHDTAVNRSASVWDDAAQRMARSSRTVASTSASDSARASNAWNAAAARMGSSASRFGRESDTAAARTGASWNAAAQRWQDASGRFVSGASAAGGALGGLGNRAAGASGGMMSGASSAAMLAAKLTLIVGAAGAAAGAIAAVPAAVSALAGMASVVGLSFSGVGEALRGYAADQKTAASAASSGASAAAASARAIRDAYQGIENAQRQAARTARDGAEAIEAAAERVVAAKRAEEQAHRAVQEALRDQARVARDSAEQIAAAERRHIDSIQDVRRAELDLDQARKDALRTMAELQERVSDLALDQEGAAIAVAKAEQAYYREMRSSESTELSRREALHALNVAKERQSDLERESQDAIEENTAAQQKGVEGSDQVVAAKDRLADAQQAEIDAERELQRTREDAAEAQRQAAQRVADARQAEADAARDVAAAERDLERAKRDAAEANEDAARQVAEAMEQLSDAQAMAAESAAAGAAGMSKFEEAMKKLTPEGQAFVRQLLVWKGHIDALKKTAQTNFLPGMTKMLKDAEVLVPIFDRNIAALGRTMSGVASRWGDLFQTKEFQDNLDQMMQNAQPIVDALGNGVIELVDAFVRLGANTEITEGFVTLLNGAFDGLVGFIDLLNANGGQLGDNLAAWGGILSWLLPLAGQLLVWASSLDPAVVGVIAAIFGLVGVGAKVAPVITGIRDLFDVLGLRADTNRGRVNKFAEALRGIAGGGGAAAGGSGGMGGPGGQGGGTGQAGGGAKGGKGGGGLGGFIAGVGGKALGTAGLALDLLSLIPEVDVGAVQAKMGPFWGAIVGGGQNSFKSVGTMWDGLWTGIGTGDWSQLQGGWESLKTNGGIAFEAVKTGASDTYNAFVEWLGGLPERAGEWFGGLWQGAVDWVTQMRDDSTAMAAEIVVGFGTWLGQLPGKALEWFLGMLDSARQVGGDFLGWAAGLPGQVLSALGNLGTLLWNAGADIVRGLWGGIQSLGAWLWDSVWGWIRSVIPGPIKAALGIASPAKEIADLTKWVPEGAAEGMIANARTATDAARGLGQSTAAAYQGGLTQSPSAGLPTGGMLAPAPTGQTIVQNHFHIAGTVVAEKQLMTLVQRETNRYAGRNIDNGLQRR